MRYVYGIAFRGDGFVMVFHPRRAGWEMPGGKVEPGESDVDAMKREFREEVGREFVPVASIPENAEGTVFAGELGGEAGPKEMDWRVFDALPEQLSFPKVEYEPLIDWARKQMTLRQSGQGQC